ncbi:PadR family transcriptional regulator [Paenibacillus sp. PK3_47]|uniref:PadR family transcriptional regulator n=1 Tax=Paenibacillus sp. PK3_47 TaxID=2072642 RepID=UPI00201E2EAE|nr:PadR family transcriptional regulator [Paenibacillus sp. PK3_47]UQZ32303.1 PadR family transcriptional regulator [Paenibacillus sp. PK3_47]
MEGIRVVNTLSYGLLTLLSASSLSGYELTQNIKPLWRAGHSQIYPLLVTMEQLGYITHERVEQADKPDKKIYTITGQGLDQLRQWVEIPAEPPAVRDELHFKLYSLWLSKPAEAKALLLKRKEFCQSELERYHLLLANNEALCAERGEARELEATTFGRYLLLSKRIMETETSIRFCTWALEQLESGAERPF